MHGAKRIRPSFCNPRPIAGPAIRRSGSGISDALLPVMKDLMLIAVTVGSFAAAWLYARSFDRL